MINNEGSGNSRRKFLGASGGMLAASALLTACGGGRGNAGAQGVGRFPGTPPWRFVFVNHVTTNSFFVPTRTGMADAAAVLGLPEPQWTGSQDGNVSEMANAVNTAITSKA